MLHLSLTLLGYFLFYSCYSIFSFMCLFCRSLFVLLSFFSFWPLCCLFFFDIRILITPLVSSNSSYDISRLCDYSSTTCVTSGAGTAYPSGTHEFTTVFPQSFVFCVVLCKLEYLPCGPGNDQRFYCTRPSAEYNRTFGHSQHQRANVPVYCT